MYTGVVDLAALIYSVSVKFQGILLPSSLSHLYLQKKITINDSCCRIRTTKDKEVEFSSCLQAMSEKHSI